TGRGELHLESGTAQAPYERRSDGGVVFDHQDRRGRRGEGDGVGGHQARRLSDRIPAGMKEWPPKEPDSGAQWVDRGVGRAAAPPTTTLPIRQPGGDRKSTRLNSSHVKI